MVVAEPDAVKRVVSLAAELQDGDGQFFHVQQPLPGQLVVVWQSGGAEKCTSTTNGSGPLLRPVNRKRAPGRAGSQKRMSSNDGNMPSWPVTTYACHSCTFTGPSKIRTRRVLHCRTAGTRVQQRGSPGRLLLTRPPRQGGLREVPQRTRSRPAARAAAPSDGRSMSGTLVISVTWVAAAQGPGRPSCVPAGVCGWVYCWP